MRDPEIKYRKLEALNRRIDSKLDRKKKKILAKEILKAIDKIEIPYPKIRQYEPIDTRLLINDHIADSHFRNMSIEPKQMPNGLVKFDPHRYVYLTYVIGLKLK
jgi:tRNA A-37 threonylcarbamoyl transferase component Bud32